MRNIKLLVLFLSLSAVIGCSSDSGEGGIDVSTVVITTKAPTFDATNLTIATGGKLSSDFSESVDYQVGVCYNTTPNPTIANQIIEAGSAQQNLDFTAVISSAHFGSTYYMKAFVRSYLTGEVKYGNELSLLIPFSLTTGIAKNISCSGFKIDITIPENLGLNSERGICYSTSQNPTVDNLVTKDLTYGAGPFTISVENPWAGYYIQPGTTYYVRSYVRIMDMIYYGTQVSFKTAGYIGGSGGYVFFDKGEMTDGWRYLEAASDILVNSNNQNQYFKWNTCNSNTFLAGLSNEIGAGKANTAIIGGDCNYTDNAAAMARYVSLNGMNDWFLPSVDELKMLYSLKKENIISYDSQYYPLISSSQQSNNSNFGFDFSTGAQTSMSKSDASRVWQVRRF